MTFLYNDNLSILCFYKKEAGILFELKRSLMLYALPVVSTVPQFAK